MKNINSDYDLARAVNSWRILRNICDFFKFKKITKLSENNFLVFIYIILMVIFYLISPIISVIVFSASVFYFLGCVCEECLDYYESVYLMGIVTGCCKEALEKDIKEKKIKEIDIVPKNIKIGYDLSNKNIVPIFRDGYYIIVKTKKKSIIFQEVYEDKKKAGLLYQIVHGTQEKNFSIKYLTLEEDRDVIEEDIPELLDNPKPVKLTKKLK